MKPISKSISLFSFAALFVASPAFAANWETGDYGGNLTMTSYIPDNVAEKPALVLSLHFCSGNEGSGQGWFKSFADQYGFMIISPKSPGNCWDAAPGRSGDRAQLAQMIDWAIENHNVDPARVFSAGASSGACMSQTMLASYPDKIAAASVLAGVPVGFWKQGNDCQVCSQQVATGSAQEWGDKVRAAGPMNYTGSRGRIQLFHAIQDQYLGSGNLAVEVAQWTNVLETVGEGVEEGDSPRSGWTRTSYSNAEGVVLVQSNWWANSPANSHDLTSNINPPLWNEVVSFFGLDMEPVPSDTSGETSGATTSADTSVVDTTSDVGTTDPTSTVATSTVATSTATTTSTSGVTSSAAVTSTAPATSTATSATTTAATTSATTTTAPTSTATTTTAPALTNGTTATSTDSGAPGVDSLDDGETGCQCQLGGAGRPMGALAALLAAGVAAVLRRRRSSV